MILKLRVQNFRKLIFKFETLSPLSLKGKQKHVCPSYSIGNCMFSEKYFQETNNNFLVIYFINVSNFKVSVNIKTFFFF